MNREDYDPLLAAIEGGDVAAVQSILKKKPGIDVDSFLGMSDEDDFPTPLAAAIYCNHKTIVELLLAHGAAVNGPVYAWKTPLQMACDKDNANEDILKLFIDRGADLDAIAEYRRETPLTRACGSKSNLDIVQLLLNAGADVNGGDGTVTPMHTAAHDGNIKAIELLIEAGADVNRVSTDDDITAGSTPLDWAIPRFGNCNKYSYYVTVKALLAAGADPNIANARGQTPLHYARSVKFVDALLDAGGDPLHRDNDGLTPLQCVYEQCIEELNEELNENPFSVEEFKVITALVAAGDRSWECVPTPCPGLEAAIGSVWQAAPDELPELVKRMENTPQTLIELYARVDDDDEEMKKVVQEVLRLLHHHFAGFPHLKEHLLNSIFGF